MYQAIFYDNKEKKCHLRDDKEGWCHFEYFPTYFKLDPNGQFQTLDGKTVSPTKKLNREDPTMYEVDVPAETRILVDLFKDEDDAPKYHNVVFLDIECVIGGALTPENVQNAGTKITAIALYDKQTATYYCFILDETKSITLSTEPGKEVIACYTENELLSKFLDKWEELDPTIITGWNSEYFDIPFLFNRIKNQLGYEQASRLSPIRRVDTTTYFDKKKQQNVTHTSIRGINHLDYMLLHQKFIMKQEPSYKLGDIGEKYVNLGKIEYKGNLDKLFKEDVAKYISNFYPDIRRIINSLQSSVKNNSITDGNLQKANPSKEIIDELNKRSKDSFTKIRQIIADSNLRDFTELYRALYDNTKAASDIIIIAEGQYQAVSAVDKEINFMSTVAKLLS